MRSCFRTSNDCNLLALLLSILCGLGAHGQSNFTYTDTCAGQTVQFSSNVVPCGSTLPGYVRWDFGDYSPFSSDLNPTHAYAATGTYLVELNYGDWDSCDWYYYIQIINVVCCNPANVQVQLSHDSICHQEKIAVNYSGANYNKMYVDGQFVKSLNGPSGIDSLLNNFPPGIHNVKFVSSNDSAFLCVDSTEVQFVSTNCTQAYLIVPDTVCYTHNFNITYGGAKYYQIHVLAQYWGGYFIEYITPSGGSSHTLTVNNNLPYNSVVLVMLVASMDSQFLTTDTILSTWRSVRCCAAIANGYMYLPDTLCPNGTITIQYGGGYYYVQFADNNWAYPYTAPFHNTETSIHTYDGPNTKGWHSLGYVVSLDNTFLCADTVMRYYYITDTCYGCDREQLITFSQKLCHITVDPTSTHNVIVWEKANKEATDSFYIYRETATNTFTQIGAVHKDSLSEFRDYGANPNMASYRYKVAAKDTCGNTPTLSRYHNTIHLQYLGGGNLIWNSYTVESETTPVTSFDVYRDDLGNDNWQLMISLSGTQHTLTDVNFNQHPNARYRVIANWAYSCTATRNSSQVYSNVISINPTTVQALDRNNNITLYPSPAEDKLFIRGIQQASKVNIFAIDGRLLKTLSAPENNVLDVAELSSGVYAAQIISNGLAVTLRWVKR